jgi:hypothetical protein
MPCLLVLYLPVLLCCCVAVVNRVINGVTLLMCRHVAVRTGVGCCCEISTSALGGSPVWRNGCIRCSPHTPTSASSSLRISTPCCPVLCCGNPTRSCSSPLQVRGSESMVGNVPFTVHMGATCACAHACVYVLLNTTPHTCSDFRRCESQFAAFLCFAACLQDVCRSS